MWAWPTAGHNPFPRGSLVLGEIQSRQTSTIARINKSNFIKLLVTKRKVVKKEKTFAAIRIAIVVASANQRVKKFPTYQAIRHIHS